MRLLRNIKRYVMRFRYMSNGYSEVTGEFGTYYRKPGNKVVLFIPERES